MEIFINVCISFYVAGFELVVIFLNSFIYNYNLFII